MKKGKVACLTLSHKNGSTVLRADDLVTDQDVVDFDSLVKSGHIKISTAAKKAEEANAKKAEEAKKKAEEANAKKAG